MSAHWYDLRFLTGEGEGRLIRYAGQFLHDKTEAVSAVQNAVLRYLRFAPRKVSAQTHRHGASLPLFASVRKVCLEKNADAANQFNAFALPGNLPLLEDDVRKMRTLVSTLPAVEQEVLTLLFEQNLSFSEIASLLEISQNEVNDILAVSIRKLQLGVKDGVI